ncbi:uncharacterized protein LOC34619705, partial [Cyclospora cayetanensis]|uniref:Uncharacterized protein LOC34619705 n=1 Tax=Cyclospora cayetanensis TaxID=88456 RepID=A0A6P6RU91_9EIME
MLQSLWKSLSSWGDLPASFPYTLGSPVPYSFELPGGFVQFNATNTTAKASAAVPSSSADGQARHSPTLAALLNPSNAQQVSVFALKRDKQQQQQTALSPSRGTVSQASFDQARNHLAKCKTLLHPNLLKVLGTYETKNALYVVTECCFALPYVLYLSQQRQKEQELEAKRPASLPQQQCSADPPPASSSSATAAEAVESLRTSAAAAAAAASASCWNLLELLQGLSFLHDQCKLAHGEVSPFSVFVTPHGKWKLSCLGLSRPFEKVHWPLFYSEILASASVAQGWEPPRPDADARPDVVDRWGLCAVFAWWLDSRRDPYSAGRYLHGNASTVAASSAVRGVSIRLNEAFLRQAMQRISGPLQRLMQQLLCVTHAAPPLVKLAEGNNPCFAGDACCQLLLFIRSFPMKSHVDKESFFEQQLPAALQQQQPQRVSPALALHLLLPELALLLMNNSANSYHCSILKCVFGIVAPLSSSSNKDKDNALPLLLFAEVLAHAFNSSDRAIRFMLLSQLAAVQSLLPDSFFLQTWSQLTLGVEDSAPPIRALTTRALPLYAARTPVDGPPNTALFGILEQRMRDVSGGVRLEAVAAAATAAARAMSSRSACNCPPELVAILGAALKDPEDAVRLAGLEASVHSGELLPLPDLVGLLSAAAFCFLSPSSAVVAAAPTCLHALTEAAKAKTAE